ncbi:hypothetical protein [Hymenobacter sp. B1770]|uniref:hypothetical protein n=1 Tax=Hymenobacter sp. B1770 TaxID=1718788 RepID=UPI003CF376E8
MDSNKNNSLENFVERHRADFDTHEPRPDLWAALEQQLSEPVATSATPVMRLTGVAETTISVPVAGGGAASTHVRGGWLQRYGVAASLALLVFAAGASEAWKSRQKVEEQTLAINSVGNSNAIEAPDAALYQAATPIAMTAADRSAGADSQLVRAVRGMEAYYTNQLARRQSELHKLSGPGMAAMRADWKRELVALDSSYRELKQDLLHHPQPDAVLTAMNRNLQVRLDILDQQLHLGAAAEADRNPSSYVLADSKHHAK